MLLKLVVPVVLLALPILPAMAKSEPLLIHTVDADDGTAFDEGFIKNRANAIRKLQEQGYQVRSIELKSHQNMPTFIIHATKNGMQYVVKLTYDDLKIIQEMRMGIA
ncbi:PepSY domain-containing protein [Moraxella sp. Tifton1]|uniref:PepSY domain-containing protein n=2 Tax=Moraxella oculi TaxID=2940516 RepID=A0ABW8U6F6_9GAMM|nr:PepSY domain-containing protein [Moraxella sp. Tifton1]